MERSTKNQLRHMKKRLKLSGMPLSFSTNNFGKDRNDSHYRSSYNSPSWFHSGHSQDVGLSQGESGHNSTSSKGITTMNFARWNYSPPRNSSKYSPPRSRKYPPPRNLKEFFAKRDSSVGCKSQNFGHICNLKNGKLISHAQESECKPMIGVYPIKEKAKVDFAHQKYPLPRHLKGFPLSGCKNQKFNDSGKLTGVDDLIKSRENECYVIGACNPAKENLMVVNDKMKSRQAECIVIGASNLPNGKLIVADDKMKSGGSESNIVGVNPLKENVIVAFAPRKYPPPRILKGFPLKRDFPVGCENGKFRRCGKLMVDNNQIESGGGECNMIGVSNLSNGNLAVAYDENKFGESECNTSVSNLSNLHLEVAHDEKLEESGSKTGGVKPLKENAKKDFAPRKYPPLRRDYPICFKRQKVDDFPIRLLMEETEPLEVVDHVIKSRNMFMEEIEPCQAINQENISRETLMEETEPFQAINHEIKSRESELDMVCVDHLKENVRADFVRRKLPSTNERSMVEIKPRQVNYEIDLNIRDKMKKALQSFQDKVNNLMLGGEPGVKILIQAAMALKEQSKWIYTSKRIGHIPGVKVGDMFQWVAEMNVIGLHNQFLRGIDYMKIDGKVIATSVVASGRYSNNDNFSDGLVYSGQGENPTVNGKQQLEDQKLERGNLALKNSMEERTPVRVIRSLKLSKPSTYTGMSGSRIFNKVYFYDGLYLVDRYWQERGKFGKLVFMFWLKRIEGQPKCTFAPGSGLGGKLTNPILPANMLDMGSSPFLLPS